jgi:magnesium chelatase family protein
MIARERQGERLRGTGAACNAQMDSALLRRHVAATVEAEETLMDAYRRGRLSARGRDRALRVARTVADLAGVDRVDRGHVITALGYRHEQDLGGEAVA